MKPTYYVQQDSLRRVGVNIRPDQVETVRDLIKSYAPKGTRANNNPQVAHLEDGTVSMWFYSDAPAAFRDAVASLP